jgi:SP family galactose:H+ symporter-like MFS transporter
MSIGLGMLMLTLSFAGGLGKSVPIFVIACSFITMGYSLGFGPVCWLMQSEMFPTIIRARAMGISVFVSNIAQFLSTLLFLPMVNYLHSSKTFLVFTALCALGLIFIRVGVVETKDKEPHVILSDFSSMNNGFRLFDDKSTNGEDVMQSSTSPLYDAVAS